jgi:predicted RNase H-like HicB family nuclease
MSNLRLQSVVYHEGEHYVAQCLNVDVSSFGDTEDEALANLQEALELYFEDAPASDAVPVEAAEVHTLTWAVSEMCRQVRLIWPPSCGHRRRCLRVCVPV